MLDFSEKIYTKLYNFAEKTNMVACCREYPALAWNREEFEFRKLKKKLKKIFSDSNLFCGLYVHFPFCTRRCSFCKYYSDILLNPKIVSDYLEALKLEIKSYQIDFSNIVLDNIFLGGGTPTLLVPSQVEEYMGLI